jgi:hypothetical protein
MCALLRSTLIASLVFVAGAAARAQSDDAEPVQYLNPMGDLLPWVFSPQLQKELEIVGDQKDKLAKLQAESMEKSRDLYTTTQDEDRQEWMRKYNEVAGRFARETDKQVRDILLPHQVKRLRQIVLQTRLQGAGFGSSAGLASGEVADELGLSESQKRELKKKEKELTAEIQRKTREFYEQLREESEDELLSVLTDAQRKKLKELVGERFDWQQPAKASDQEKSSAEKSSTTKRENETRKRADKDDNGSRSAEAATGD